MKKLISFLLAIMVFSIGISQNYTNTKNYGNEFSRLKAKQNLKIPYGATLLRNTYDTDPGDLFYYTADSSMYIHNGNLWMNVTGKRAGIDSVTTRADSLFTWEKGLPKFLSKTSASIKGPSKGLLIGNSTIAAYMGQDGVDKFLLSSADSVEGTTINNQAVPGNTILQQQTIYLADTNKAKYDWIIVEIGLNDINYSEPASAALGRYQTFIDTINATKKAGAKILVATMTPALNRFINVLGNINGYLALQNWLDMNNAIMGSGPNAIYGVDYRTDAHTLALDDGSFALSYMYDMGDGIHETNAARNIIAESYRQALQKAGFLIKSGSQFVASSTSKVNGAVISNSLKFGIGTTNPKLPVEFKAHTNTMYRGGISNLLLTGPVVAGLFMENPTSITTFYNYNGETVIGSKYGAGDMDPSNVRIVIDDITGKVSIPYGLSTSHFKLSALNTAPSSSTDTGTTGEVRITSAGIFICTATNTWIKCTGTTF